MSEDRHVRAWRISRFIAAFAASTIVASSGRAQGWQERQVLMPEDAPGVSDYWFGWAAAISGRTVVVGSWGDATAGIGSAFLFQPNSVGAWEQVAQLQPNNAVNGDGFGKALDIEGEVVVVGASGDLNARRSAGAAYVFRENDVGHWTEEAQLQAIDSTPGNYFGESVSMSASTILVGAIGDKERGELAGAAYLFRENEHGGWDQIAKLIGDSVSPGEQFGHRVALSGNTAIVTNRGLAVPGDPSMRGPASAYVFREDTYGSWNQIAAFVLDEFRTTDIRASISLDGSTVVVGANIYREQLTGDWSKVATLQGAAGETFSSASAISGSTVAILGGNPGEGSSMFFFVEDNPGQWNVAAQVSIDVSGFFRVGGSIAIDDGVAIATAMAPMIPPRTTGVAWLFQIPEPSALCSAMILAITIWISAQGRMRSFVIQ